MSSAKEQIVKILQDQPDDSSYHEIGSGLAIEQTVLPSLLITFLKVVRGADPCIGAGFLAVVKSRTQCVRSGLPSSFTCWAGTRQAETSDRCSSIATVETVLFEAWRVYRIERARLRRVARQVSSTTRSPDRTCFMFWPIFLPALPQKWIQPPVLHPPHLMASPPPARRTTEPASRPTTPHRHQGPDRCRETRHRLW